jgi:hypothetical protein
VDHKQVCKVQRKDSKKSFIQRKMESRFSFSENKNKKSFFVFVFVKNIPKNV